MSTLREQAQFIDELRQHYRRLDGLLVVYAGSLPINAAWEVTEPMIALRKLLFGEVGNPNLKAAAAASPVKPHEDPPLGSHASDLKELRIVQAENDRLRAESADRVCPGSGWPSITTMAVSTGTGICGICSRLVLVGPLNQCHTHRAVLSLRLVPDAPEAHIDLLSELERSREAATAGQVEDPEDAGWDRFVDGKIAEDRGM